MNGKEEYRLLMLIATPKLADKAADMFLKSALPIQYRLMAEGTASSEIMDMLGLGSTDKAVLVSAVPQSFGHAMLKKLHTELRLDAVNSGIAFTLPLTGVSKLMLQVMQRTAEESGFPNDGKDENRMSDTTYALIAVVVDRGFSNEVMDAARAAGAGGGTVVHSRSVAGEEGRFLGLSVQEEKEIVLILAEHEKKVAIMRSVGENCGMHSEAKGIVLSLPIDEVQGI